MGDLPPRSLQSIKSLMDRDAQDALQGWTDKLAPRGGSWPSGCTGPGQTPRRSQTHCWGFLRGRVGVGHRAWLWWEKGSLQTETEHHLGRPVTAESSGEPPRVKPMLGQGQSTHSTTSGSPCPAARSPKTAEQQVQEPTYFLYFPCPKRLAFHEDPLNRNPISPGRKARWNLNTSL